eukprot:s329_g22.t1
MAAADVDAVLQDLWRDCADPPEVRSFQHGRGRGLVSPRKMAVGEEVFRDTPLVAMQNLFSQRLTPCCLGCMAPVGSFRQLLQRILRNAGQTLESDFPSVNNDELLSQPRLSGITWPCPTPGCKMLFCSRACRERELQRGAHRLLCLELDDRRLRKWAQFKALDREDPGGECVYGDFEAQSWVTLAQLSSATAISLKAVALASSLCLRRSRNCRVRKLCLPFLSRRTFSMKRPSMNGKRQQHLVESAMAAAVRAIPKGVRTRLGSELTRLVAQRVRGWYRVVASDGSFLGASDKEQLAALQREGARPRLGETVATWAQRCKCRYVATYRASLQRACLAATDPGVNKWPAWSERLSLSGGKLFHHPQEQRPAAPAFASKRASAKPPKTIKQALKTVQPRLRKLLTARRLEELQKRGATRLRRVLQPKDKT